MCDHNLKRLNLYLFLFIFKGFTMMTADETGLSDLISSVSQFVWVLHSMYCSTPCTVSPKNWKKDTKCSVVTPVTNYHYSCHCWSHTPLLNMCIWQLCASAFTPGLIETHINNRAYRWLWEKPPSRLLLHVEPQHGKHISQHPLVVQISVSGGFHC